MFYEKIEGCVLDTHLLFARLKSSEYQCSPEVPGDHNLEGQLSKIHIENQDNFILTLLICSVICYHLLCVIQVMARGRVILELNYVTDTGKKTCHISYSLFNFIHFIISAVFNKITTR